MASPSPAPERDAQLLGLALLHGYVNQAQLRAAANEDPDPSAILTSLRTAGIVDEPCLHGLEQSLDGLNAIHGDTTATRAISNRPDPMRTLGLPAPDQNSGSTSNSNIFRQLTLANWKHYQNLRFIGEGGMGRIFKALDPDLKRTVALKFLRGQDPVQLSRFLFEAQAQALVEHPNICKVYEVSEWLGHHYIAMQYVNGPSLGKLAPDLTLDATLRIMQTVAEAVHAAHRRGLIHRDIKPSNIQVEKDEDNVYRPYVLDFGLARSQDSAGLTVSGLVVGTTAYMAPEQARGEAHHIDRRTDVYGLGATLYQVFTGMPPFGEAVGVDCLRMVLDVEPQPLRKVVPDLPADLETIVMKCMEKDPTRRYDNAHMLAEDLRRLREGEPILARPATLAYRASRFAKRNRALVSISTVALAGLLVFGGVALSTSINSSIRASHAQHFGQEAERIEALLRYARLLPRQNIEPRLTEARQRLSNMEGEARSAGRLAAGPGAYAIGRCLLAFGEVDQAMPHLQRAMDSGMHSPELSYALGRGYGMLYQRELERTRSLSLPELREARLREIEQQWRDPALAQLRQAKGLSLEPPEYLEALVDSFGGHTDTALEKARIAIAKAPWFYEAKGLEGELLLAQAQESPISVDASPALAAASASVAQASLLAPSDAGLWILEARIQREALRRAGPMPGWEGSLDRCRVATRTALQIRPGDPSPLVHLAFALLAAGQIRDEGRGSSLPIIEEGLVTTERLLAAAPGNPEALAARIGLLETRGRWKRNTGLDPDADFSESVSTGHKALSLWPGDTDLLAGGLRAAQSRFTYLASVGGDVGPAIDQAFAWAKDLEARFPDAMVTHVRLATLYNEVAEYKRLHGGDPRPPVERAIAEVEAALKRGLDAQRYREFKGTAHLIRAQHALAIGVDPIPDSEAAITAFRERAAVPPRTGLKFGTLAEALLLRAETALEQQDREPGIWIEEADSALANAIPMMNYYWLFQLQGQSECLKARWAIFKGLPADRYIEAGLKAYSTAIKLSRNATSFEGIARLHLVRANSSERRKNDPAEGIKAARKGLELDPRSGETSLLLGSLYMAQAKWETLSASSQTKAQGQAMFRQALQLNGNLKRKSEAYFMAKDSRRTSAP